MVLSKAILGTGYTKMGWAGNTEPQYDIPTVVADNTNKVNNPSIPETSPGL